MSDGHRTTLIQRPRDLTASSSIAAASRDNDDSRFAELISPVTTAIKRDKRLVKGRGKRLVFALVAVVIAAALIASLFVLPVKSWLQQRDDLARKRNELAVLSNANAQLAADVNRLQTPDGIREAARQEVGFVGVGEQRISVLDTPDAPVTLPIGWPYDAVTQIVAVRAGLAAAADTAAPVSAAPTTATP
ncbi:MAG TPA: septum formation initiator family protein [Ilumatobacteraceae bacterium]|nr:septum formation initiator family protein [Ilumatobacteraceae bacterium]